MKKQTGRIRFFASKLTGVLLMSMLNCQQSPAEETVREAVFAGSWYDADPHALRSSIEKYIASGTALSASAGMLISPHAGHAYSGPVAGKAYATVSPDVKRVFLIGPSHRVFVQGLSIPGVDYYATPLGKVPLDKEVIGELRKNKLVGSDMRAHSQEHCLEIQLPFLQVAIDSFSLIPVLVSDVQPETIAGLISPYYDEQTLIVASSDFAHVNNADECRKLDERSIQSIMNQDLDGFIEACGETPIRALLHLSRERGLRPELLDACNSRDLVPGPKNSYTVGYAAIAFVSENGSDRQPAAEAGHAKTSEKKIGQLNQNEKTFLLKLARSGLEAAVNGLQSPEPADIPAVAMEETGCFVTLRKHGELRGCIGYIEGVKPLYQAVIDNARNAALEDHRFPPVKPDELDDIEIEISVLTKPEPVPYQDPEGLLDKIEAGKDGIILNKGWHQSTYLPQVWEQIPEKEKFLEYLSRKAGMPSDGWKTAEVKRYRAIHFEE
ncbi:MAG: AmmeMemoRadiSam system protein B [Chitinivibrionales bacterium]|nr:AmmeMemoRadiSam system protein B [Chitinivibrionales bacterium]